MRGSTFRRCGCRDDAGHLVKDCPRLGHERNHGSWFYRVDVGRDPDTGRRKERRKGGFRTQREAQEKLAVQLALVGAGEYRDDDKLTLGVFLEGWLQRKVDDGALRPSSERMYRLYVTEHLVPALGPVRLRDLRPLHVDQLLRDLRAAGKGPTTVRRVHAVLRSALSSAKRARLVSFNAAEDVDLPTAPRPKVHPWEAAELAAFLDHSAGHRLGVLYEVLAFTGLRRGEVAALRWSDVDLEHGVITVRTQLVQVGHGVVEAVPKTRAGEHRRFDIGGRVIGALLAHRIAQDAERTSWGSGYTDRGRVFAREDGSDLHPETITKTFARLIKAAGLRPVRLHDLRHGTASLAMAAEVPLPVVSKWLGHSSVAITADLYSHFLPGVGRKAADALESLVPARSTGPAPTAAPTGTPADDGAPTMRPPEPGNDSGRPPGRVNALVRGGAPSGTRTPNPLVKGVAA
jgi:integrase